MPMLKSLPNELLTEIFTFHLFLSRPPSPLPQSQSPPEPPIQHGIIPLNIALAPSLRPLLIINSLFRSLILQNTKFYTISLTLHSLSFDSIPQTCIDQTVALILGHLNTLKGASIDLVLELDVDTYEDDEGEKLILPSLPYIDLLRKLFAPPFSTRLTSLNAHIHPSLLTLFLSLFPSS